MGDALSVTLNTSNIHGHIGIPHWYDMAREDGRAESNEALSVTLNTSNIHGPDAGPPHWYDMAREDERTASIEVLAMAGRNADSVDVPTTADAGSHFPAEDEALRAWMPSSWVKLLASSCIVEWVGETALKTGAGNVEEWLDVSTTETVTMEAQRNGGVPWVEFSSEASLRAFVNASLQESGSAFLTQSESMLQPVQILDTIEFPRGAVNWTCHMKLKLCHHPLKDQRFWWTKVRFVDTGKVDVLMFTQHKLHPLCRENCTLGFHTIEIVLLDNMPRIMDHIVIV